MDKTIDLTKMRFGRVVSRLPEQTLVCDTSPPNNYYLIPGGFLNSDVSGNAKVIRFMINEAKDGSALKYLDGGQGNG